MLSDNVALALALVAVWLATKPATAERTFGYKRAEVLAALANGVLLVALAIWIFVEAAMRLRDPGEPLGGWMVVIALIGLAVNAAAGLVLARARQSSLNVDAAFRHVFADLLGSFGVAVAGVVILTTGWDAVDPLVSIFIGVLVLASAWSILRDSTADPPGGDSPRDRRRRPRPPARLGARCRRGPRPPRLDDHFRLPGALGARTRPTWRGLPWAPAGARAPAPRRVRHRAHHVAGRPRGRRRPRRDRPLLNQEDAGPSQCSAANAVEDLVRVLE